MKKRIPLIQFIIGLVMLTAGGYWFMSSVTVTTGFYGLRLGNMQISGGLVVVPFIAGIIWLFLNIGSIGAKILTCLGLVIILASVIMSTQFVFRSRTLYEYLIILVLIFGGAALSLQVLLAKPKDTGSKSPREEYEELENELDRLRKGK